MKYIKAFLSFWYHFIVGDDWRIAVSVVLGLCLITLLTHAHIQIWWLLPVLIVAMLTLSLWFAVRHQTGKKGSTKDNSSSA